MNRIRFLALHALALLAAACSPAPSHSSLQVEDSSGVALVSYGDSLDQLPVLRLGTRSRALAGDDAHPIGALRGVAFLTDSTIAIADGYANEVWIVNVESGARVGFGRTGEGPGEFRQILWIEPASDGGVYVYDPMQTRLSRFDELGDFMEGRVTPTRASHLGIARGALNGHVVLMGMPEKDSEGFGRSSVMIEGDPGVFRDTNPFRYDRCNPKITRLCGLDTSFEAGTLAVGGQSILVIPIKQTEDEVLQARVLDGDGELVARFELGSGSRTFSSRSFVGRSGDLWLYLLPDSSWLRVGFDSPEAALVDLPDQDAPRDARGDEVAIVHTDSLGVRTVRVITLESAQ